MVHLPQSEPSIHLAADNKADYRTMIMPLMQLDGCVLWGDISGSEVICMELFNPSQLMTYTISV